MLRYAKRGSGERLATGRLSRHGELIDLEGAVSVCSKNVGTRRRELLTHMFIFEPTTVTYS